MKAVLFDIDGTILNSNKAGRTSLIRATEDVFGTVGHMEKVDFQGKTDPLILYESLLSMGFDKTAIHDKIDDLKIKYFEYLRETIFKNEATLMPGIEEISARLFKDSSIILGLLTGNFHESARIKLSRFDLNKYFEFGVFGDDAANRNDMPGIGREKIKELYNVDIDFSRMFIIGDTIHDINCANNSGAVSIAVGTGWVDKDILLPHNPDYYFDDLGDVDRVLSVIRE
ncbi:MAG: HAD hydrolase-like protein [bacterium]|nr:HAD hydrolase-like protein [bacterium]